MKKGSWEKKIKNNVIEVGTYKPAFDDVIETLATILEQRDEAFDQYIKTGAHPVVTHTNKAGASNPAKNPCLEVWLALNTQALSYWKELGLTPSGLKKINEELLKRKKSSFGEVLLNELSKK